MQVVGPACLVATLAVAVLGIVFLRLWRTELRRQRRDMELRTRAQLQVMATDLLNKRRSSSNSSHHHKTMLTSGALQDPVIRRQLMLQLRRQSAVEIGWEDFLKMSTTLIVYITVLTVRLPMRWGLPPNFFSTPFISSVVTCAIFAAQIVKKCLLPRGNATPR